MSSSRLEVLQDKRVKQELQLQGLNQKVEEFQTKVKLKEIGFNKTIKEIQSIRSNRARGQQEWISA